MHKNRFWSLLLALIVAVSIMTPGKSIVAAGPDAVYPVYFGNIQIDSLNKDDIMGDGGSVSYDPDRHTLYISNYSIQSTDPAIAVRVDEPYPDFTIDISGKVSLAGNGEVEYGIGAHSSDVTITSSDGTGSLEVKGRYAGITACNLTIEGNVSIDAEGSLYGILLEQNLTMNSGYLTARGSNEYGITSYFEQDKGTFKFNGGEAHINGGIAGIDCIEFVLQNLDNKTPVLYVQGDGCGVRATHNIKVYGGYLEASSGQGEPGIGVFVSGEDGEISMEGGIVRATGDAIGVQTSYLWMNEGYISGEGNTGIYINTEMDVTGGEVSAYGGEYGIKSAEADFIFYESLKRVSAKGSRHAILTNGTIMNEAHILRPEGGSLEFPECHYFIDAEGYPATKVDLGKRVIATYKPGEGKGPEIIINNAFVGEPMTIIPYPDNWTAPDGQHFDYWKLDEPDELYFFARDVEAGQSEYIPQKNMVFTAYYGCWVTHYEDAIDNNNIVHCNINGNGTDYDITTEPQPYNTLKPGESYMASIRLATRDATAEEGEVVSMDGKVLSTFTMEQDTYVDPEGFSAWHGIFIMPYEDVYLRFKTTPSESPMELFETAKLSKTTYTYDGTEKRPSVTIEGLTEGEDFLVSYADNTDAGIALAMVEGKGKYAGCYQELNFTIKPKTVKTPAITAKNVTFNGKNLAPAITVKDGSTTLKKGSDYTVKYAKSARKNVGTYKFTVTLTGNYEGSGTGTFKINPKGTSLATSTAASKAITIKWKKQSAKMAKERITGYKIQLATNKAFTKNKKTVTVKGYSAVSRKISSLKGKTRYYIRIRTYKVIGKTYYYSPWSAVKTVTTKK